MGGNMQAEDVLPLTEVCVYILLSLAPGAKHGYAVMKDVQGLSNNRIVLSTGTLYGALKRLLEQQWITRSDGMTETNGRQQKEYLLTELGRCILIAETARLEHLVRVAATRHVFGKLS